MKKILLYAATAALLVASACDDFGDINKNPNASETPLTSALLTNAESALGGTAAGGTNFLAGLYAQYFSQTQYTDNSLYSAQDASWGGEMSGNMYDLKNIININSDPATAAIASLQGSNNNQIAIARILLAYRFSVLTDRWGDIPYFEALQGNTQPAVDAQELIYADLFKELSEAVDQFDDLGAVKGDIVYGGNNEKWQKFANSLRVILALRVSEVDPELGEAQVNAALDHEAGVFASNDDNLKLVYPGGNYNNPWLALAGDQAVSTTVAAVINATDDRRRAAFGTPLATLGGDVKGFPYGWLRDDAVVFGSANPDYSLILSSSWRLGTSTLPIITYADVLLARSEAAFLEWTGEDYVALYGQAIEASWRQWNVYDAAAYATFMALPQNTLDGSGTEAEYAKIATQRWLTFFPNGTQGWSEWRRTGYPELTPTPFAVNSTSDGQIPRRFTFANAEYNFNGANVEAARERMGGDTDVTRVWWDGGN